MIFRFHYYKQTAPPGLYSFISGGIRTIVSYRQLGGMDKLCLSVPAHASTLLIRVVPPLQG